MKAIFFLTIILLSFVASEAQELVDGERLDSIQIGKSTVYDVISNYGTDYKLKKHSDYSNVLVYEKLGLSFYSCQADPKQEIFVIMMQPPFSVKTSKGIILGKSTFKDLFNAYGKWSKTSAGFEYEETGFYFDSEAETFSDFETNNTNFDQAKKVASDTSSKDIAYSSSRNNSVVGIPQNSVSVSNNNSNATSNNSTRNNQSNNISTNRNSRANSSKSKDTSEDDEFKSELKEWGNEIVNKIELIEKGRLRQCHTDFAARNN